MKRCDLNCRTEVIRETGVESEKVDFQVVCVIRVLFQHIVERISTSSIRETPCNDPQHTLSLVLPGNSGHYG